jgi:hypothetical protein
VQHKAWIEHISVRNTRNHVQKFVATAGERVSVACVKLELHSNTHCENWPVRADEPLTWMRLGKRWYDSPRFDHELMGK